MNIQSTTSQFRALELSPQSIFKERLGPSRIDTVKEYVEFAGGAGSLGEATHLGFEVGFKNGLRVVDLRGEVEVSRTGQGHEERDLVSRLSGKIELKPWGIIIHSTAGLQQSISADSKDIGYGDGTLAASNLWGRGDKSVFNCDYNRNGDVEDTFFQAFDGNGQKMDVQPQMTPAGELIIRGRDGQGKDIGTLIMLAPVPPCELARKAPNPSTETARPGQSLSQDASHRGQHFPPPRMCYRPQ